MPAALEDLWPSDLLGEPEQETPVAILRQQAALLAQKTRHTVVADVRPGDRNGADFCFVFELSAPRLAYRLPLFTIRHGISLYPVTITAEPPSGPRPTYETVPAVRAESKEQFVSALKEVFAKRETATLIQALAAQARVFADPID